MNHHDVRDGVVQEAEIRDRTVKIGECEGRTPDRLLAKAGGPKH